MNTGFHVLTASDGLEGLGKAQAEKPDLIISDLDLPRMDGLSMIRELKTCASLAHVPVIVCSTSQDQTTRYLIRHMGAIAYIVKPLNMQAFKDLQYCLKQQFLQTRLPTSVFAESDSVESDSTESDSTESDLVSSIESPTLLQIGD